MFFVARALLRAEGADPKTHRGAHVPFHERLVRSGRLPAELARAFDDAWALRELAEYGDEPALGHDEADAALAAARAFVSALEPLLPDDAA